MYSLSSSRRYTVVVASPKRAKPRPFVWRHQLQRRCDAVEELRKKTVVQGGGSNFHRGSGTAHMERSDGDVADHREASFKVVLLQHRSKMHGTKKGRLVVPLAVPVSSALPTHEDEEQRISALDYSNGRTDGVPPRFGEDISAHRHEASRFAKVSIAALPKESNSDAVMLSTYTNDNGNVLVAFGDDTSSSSVDNGKEEKVLALETTPFPSEDTKTKKKKKKKSKNVQKKKKKHTSYAVTYEHDSRSTRAARVKEEGMWKRANFLSEAVSVGDAELHLLEKQLKRELGLMKIGSTSMKKKKMKKFKLNVKVPVRVNATTKTSAPWDTAETTKAASSRLVQIVDAKKKKKKKKENLRKTKTEKYAQPSDITDSIYAIKEKEEEDTAALMQSKLAKLSVSLGEPAGAFLWYNLFASSGQAIDNTARRQQTVMTAEKDVRLKSRKSRRKHLTNLSRTLGCPASASLWQAIHKEYPAVVA